ncbi:MAG: AMP-binding protein, partial [Actinomycetota bacterium]
STELLVGLLGAQAAGGASVALDPTLPDGRLDAIAAAAGLDAVLTDDVARAARFDVPTVDLGALQDGDPAAFVALVEQLDPDDDAYVIFTSGSTGVPRGVAVTHANLGASTGARDTFFDGVPARFLVSPSPGFDSSVVGLYWPLATGGTVVMPTDDEVRDADRLAARIHADEVTHTLMVPSLWRVLLDRRADQLRRLDTAIVAGESCPPTVVADHRERLPGVALVNEYGPTETTVWATAARLDTTATDTVPIGGPIPGVTIRVADPGGRRVPTDVPGELLIAGPGVTAGYLDDPVATDARFVETDGRRWYRTGDLVRSDGTTIDFIGRTDDQLNVGGVRLEPGDVERALDALDEVRASVVVAVGQPTQLVAHVELVDGVALDEASLRRQVAASLPAAAVPRRLVAQVTIPRTTNGKIDRAAAAALPLPESTPVVDAVDDGLDPTAAAVLSTWRRLLAPAPIELDTDFFDAGGDSLTAAALVSAVGDELEIDVPIATLLAGPTPRRMVAVLDDGGGAGASGAEAVASASGVVRPVWFRRGVEGGLRIVMTPSWDDLFGYQDLAESFPPDVEVIVLAYEPTSAATMITTVPELVDELQAAHDRLPSSDGPVAVLGWSIGGVAANELAARLSASGAEIDLVALVDTFFPGEERHLWSNRWWKYKSMARWGAVPELLEELRVFARRRVDRLRRRFGRNEPVNDDTPRLVGSFPAEAFGHQPADAGVPMVLYRASTTNPARTVARWVTVAPDLDDVVVVGRHRGFDSIMRPDKVGAISADVVARLSRS